MEDFKLPPQLETIEGTEKGSHYVVFAKGGDLLLAIRPLVFSNKERMFYIGARLRAKVANPNGQLQTVSTVFGIPGFKMKTAHASTECGVPVMQLPSSPWDVRKRVYENKLPNLLVADLFKRITEAGATLNATEEQIIEYLCLGYDSDIPDIKPVFPENNTIIYGAGL